ncbi:retrovirus-related pol polyprotein from transposon TNT 1-94 [Tanacetum coccineum]
MAEKDATPNNAKVIALGKFKLYLEPLAPKVLNSKDAHIDYNKHSQEHADTLREIVEHARALRPLDSNLDSACKIVQRIQEVLVYVKDTCPCLTKPSEKLVAITPLNENKKVRMKSSTSASRSQPPGNAMNNRISRTTSSNMMNKVEDHPMSIKSNLNKKNHVIEPICNANVKHTTLNANSELIYVKCNQCIFDANHDLCVLDFVNDVNVRSKYKYTKRSKTKKTWKPTGKLFADIGYMWKPTGQTFTIDGNTFLLTRIAFTKVEPLKETTSKSVTTHNPEIKIYNRKTKVAKSVDLINKSSILGYRHSNILEPNKNWGSTTSNSPSFSLVNFRFGNDQIEKIMGFGDYQLRNVTISWVYYVEGLGHNLFFVGQLCDSDLELAKQGLVRGLPKLKFEKGHLYSACSLGKIKKSSHKPKVDDTNQEKLYLLHMDLCGPMRVESINGKEYILVIVDDYSRFTWAKFLRSKDEAPEVIIKCLKQIQVRMNETVCNTRTDNRTEFVNQTLKDYYENVRISHQTSVARTPQQNGVVKRRNRTLVEAARTMLIFLKAPLYL